MRFKIILFALFSSFAMFSQNIVLERNIKWDKENPLIFEYADIKDSVSGLFSFNEIVDLNKNLNLKVEFVQWDTIRLPKDSIKSQLKNYFSYTEIKNQVNNKFRYQFIIGTYVSTKDSNVFLRLNKFRIIVENTNHLKAATIKNSVLAQGKWHKIKVLKNGIYKISSSQLSKMGFENPSNVSVYGYAMGMLPKSTIEPAIDDLQKIPVWKNGNDIYFYGSEANTWKYDSDHKMYYHQDNKFSDTTYYYLSDSYDSPELIDSENFSSSMFIETDTYDDFAFYEKDSYNLFKTGATWYGDYLNANQQKTINFSFSDIITSSPIKIYYSLIAKTNAQSSFDLRLDKSVTPVNIPVTITTENFTGGQAQGFFNTTVTGNSFNISVTYKNSSDSKAEAYIDYVGVNVTRKLNYNGSQLIFRNKENLQSGNDIKYNISNISSVGTFQVWDISNINKPKKINFTVNNQVLSFYSSSDVLKTFILFNTNSGINEPIIDNSSFVPIKNQDIHGTSIPDMIIVTPDSAAIYDQALRLAQFRRNNDGLNVLTVKVSEVYNEFSAGRRDVTAIRNMVKYFYERGLTESNKIKYLLLFGDGTYVNKTDFPGNNNLLPTYEFRNSIYTDSSYVTDDYFGWTTYNNEEDECQLSIGIGRLPINDFSQANELVNKLIAYANPINDDDWRNYICFIADDGDGTLHIGQADNLAEQIRKKYPYFNIQKLYLDAYTQVRSSLGETYPDVNDALNNRMSAGALIINYTGHGNERQLTNEMVINIKDIRKWNNKTKLPLFITATCEFSRWDDMDYSAKKGLVSAGEETLLNPNGGAISLLTTTRLVYSAENFNLNQAFYKYAFEKDENGNPYRLGDIFKFTKNDYLSRGMNRLNFTLLGDPSLIIGNPKKIRIITDSINQKNAQSNPIVDTLKALSIVKISGHIQGNATEFEQYNGILSVSVIDKPDTLTTLANDKESNPFRFIRQGATVYKGLVNVENGKFSFSFPVPLDIKHNIDQGNIIYYAASPNGSYAGYFNKFDIGGITGNNQNDHKGPTIKLFMNDSNFVNGGITNANPLLLAQLEDQNGMNASGIGIGHDINAVLDENFSQVYLLNSNFRTEINNFTKGTTTYAFSNLTPGEHMVKVIAWDIFNNPFESEIKFKVVEDNNFVLNRVINFPNPMKEYTYFTIEHNRPDEEINLKIYIYSFTGALVNILNYNGLSGGFRTPPLQWNRTNNAGYKVGNGIYPYKIVVTEKNGSSVESTGKLVIY